MPRKVEYKVKPETVTDFQDIYDGLLMSKDMLEKFRIAGEARPDAEAKNNAAIERVLRWCKSFKIEIKT
jgi:hypothetical protein